MDKESPDLSHSADRDSHFLVAPHVPLLEEHVGYMVAAGFHDQPPDLPYLAVGRTDGQFAVYLYLVRSGTESTVTCCGASRFAALACSHPFP